MPPGRGAPCAGDLLPPPPMLRDRRHAGRWLGGDVWASGGPATASARRRRWGRAPPLALAALALLAAAPRADADAAAKKPQRRLAKTTLVKGDCANARAQEGDALAVHYRAFADGNKEPFDETYTVGRPHAFTLGQGQGLVGLEGVTRGVTNMCLGEKRRLRVPPHLGLGEKPVTGTKYGGLEGGMTLVFEAELLAVNDASVTAASAVSTDSLPPHMYCNACHTLVELFFVKWIETIAEQERKNNVNPNDGGKKMPAVTYNDDVEAMLQGFCTSDAVLRPGWGDHIRPACDTIMLGHKREFVAKFMSVEAHPRLVPSVKNEVCGTGMVQACGAAIDDAGVPSGACAQCKLVVGDVAFELQQRERLVDAGEKRRRKLAKEVVDNVCNKLEIRHFKGYKLSELCNDLVDDHAGAIVDAGVEMLGTGATSEAGSAARLHADVCVRAAGLCGRDEL